MSKLFIFAIGISALSTTLSAMPSNSVAREQLQRAIIRELSPINESGDSKLSVDIDLLELDSQGIRRFRTTSSASIDEGEVSAKIRKTIDYTNRHDGTNPELQIQLSVNGDMKKYFGDGFEEATVHAPIAVWRSDEQAQKIIRQYEGALEYSAKLLDARVGTDGEFECLHFQQDAKLDLESLPAHMEQAKQPLSAANQNTVVTPESIRIEITLHLNPFCDYFKGTEEREVTDDGIQRLFASDTPFSDAIPGDVYEQICKDLEKLRDHLQGLSFRRG